MILNVLLVSLLLSLLQASQTPNCGCEDKPQVTVLAVVNGIKLTRNDLSIDAKTKVSLAQDTVIAARDREVTLQANKILIDSEAKRRGLTVPQLFEIEVAAKVPPPTEAEIKAFYEQNKARIASDLKSVKHDIIATFRNEREAIRAGQFTELLRASAQISVSSQPVTPPTNDEDLDRVFATINGVNITSRDVEKSLVPLIFRVQQQVYAFRKQDLDLKVNDILLEQEARRLGTSPESLINQNVKVRVPIITEQQVRTFYNEQKTRLPGDFGQVKVQIMQFLLEQEERKLFLAYAEQLRKAAAIQIYLTEPLSR